MKNKFQNSKTQLRTKIFQIFSYLKFKIFDIHLYFRKLQKKKLLHKILNFLNTLEL